MNCERGQDKLEQVIIGLSRVVECQDKHESLFNAVHTYLTLNCIHKQLEEDKVLVCKYRLAGILKDAGCQVEPGLYSLAKMRRAFSPTYETRTAEVMVHQLDAVSAVRTEIVLGNGNHLIEDRG